VTKAQGSVLEVLGRPPIHPFPARMAPGLALSALKELTAPGVVLDPMAGSGTVLAVARAHGHRAVGFDLDPLAVLIARVWTQTIHAAEVRSAARDVVRNAERTVRRMDSAEAFPAGCDVETRGFVRYWFDPAARKQLAALARHISAIEVRSTREALWCAFSRLIIAKQAGASRARDLAHSRPHRAFKAAPQLPLPAFLRAAEVVLRGCLTTSDANRGPRGAVEIGDVRQLAVSDQSIDLVFTSPPYLNAIDYVRCSKFSLVWMGYSVKHLREIREVSIGAERAGDMSATTTRIVEALSLKPRLSGRMERILHRYVSDTIASVAEIARVLRPNGHAVYVVGENTIRGTFVRTGALVHKVAEEGGLRLTRRTIRYLPANRRYMPPPGAADGSDFEGRMRREVVLTFRRGRV
jgi:DNA modification methylase